ncbi:MAG: hypothetical protein ACE5K7_03720 [Phycisphaerae bacterium]
MLQCCECEHFVRGPDGRLSFRCDPFATIKEPHCLVKWQLIKLDMMVRAYQATVQIYRRIAPLQEKIFRQMEREADQMDEADRWKYTDQDDSRPDQGQPDEPPSSSG